MDVFDLHPDTLVSLGEIVGEGGIIGVSVSTWYKGLREGRYPQPVAISKKRRAWRAGDLQDYLRNLGAQKKVDEVVSCPP